MVTKTSSHPTFVVMISEAVKRLKYPHSTRPAIKKYLLSNYKLSSTAPALLNNAIRKGVKIGYFCQPKGSSGPLKLNKEKLKLVIMANSLSAKRKPAAKKIKASKPKTTAMKHAALTKNISTASSALKRKSAAKKTTSTPALKKKRVTLGGKTTASKAPRALKKPARKSPAKAASKTARNTSTARKVASRKTKGSKKK